MTDARTAIVGRGYDRMADTWEAWSAQIEDGSRDAWCGELVERLPEGAKVAELGCGNGTAETIRLAQRFRLTGIDLSEEQLRRARDRVPEAEFLQADITSLDLPAGTLDAVCAFYVLNHVPRDLLGGLFALIHSWLRAGGLFTASLGTGDEPGWHGEWLGVPMYFSSFLPEENIRLLTEAGLEVLRDELVTIAEPEGNVRFHWVMAAR